jgi:hypothetical protein
MGRGRSCVLSEQHSSPQDPLSDVNCCFAAGAVQSLDPPLSGLCPVYNCAYACVSVVRMQKR